MTAPKLSICIPTYNRAALLETLLGQLGQDLKRLPFETEIVVADNASDDDTGTVLDNASKTLPLRHTRHDINIGAEANVNFAVGMGRGDYALYLADDDRLIPSGVIAALEMLDAHPEAGVLYAPWSLVDLHDRRDLGQFYRQPETVVIPRGDYSRLADHVTEHGIFSEISIQRRETLARVRPVISDMAFWGFTAPCEYLAAGDIVYAARPFYASVTRHDGADAREQVGNTEVMAGWDKYRGGLDHMIGLALSHGGLRNPAQVRQRAERMIADRMTVALRLRLLATRDPIESYYIATRLRGLGHAGDLPVPLDQIRLAAAASYAGRILPGMVGADRLAVLGDCTDATLENLGGYAAVPVEPVADASALRPTDTVLALGERPAPDLAALEARCAAALSETELFRKFP